MGMGAEKAIARFMREHKLDAFEAKRQRELDAHDVDAILFLELEMDYGVREDNRSDRGRVAHYRPRRP